MSGGIDPLPAHLDPTVTHQDITPLPAPTPQLQVAEPPPRRLPKVPYSAILAEYICEQVANGVPLNSISLNPNINSKLIIQQWLDESEDFRTLLKVAKRARGEYYRDEVHHTTMNADKDENRLKGLIKLAEWDDPGTYGQKATVTGSANTQIQIVVVNTGVPAKDSTVPMPVLRNDPVPEIKSILPSYQPPLSLHDSPLNQFDMEPSDAD